MRIFGYLRASTDEQDATRAKSTLENFASGLGVKISTWVIENESGAKLERPELFKLLQFAEPGDAILIEQIDRITRLNESDWKKLYRIIDDKQVRIISLDLPTSHQFARGADEFTARIFEAVNKMMLDILAATARKDYTDRRRRQAEGIKKAKTAGRYTGRKNDDELQNNVRLLLTEGKSYNQVIKLLKCSRATVAKVAKQIKDSDVCLCQDMRPIYLDGQGRERCQLCDKLIEKE